MVEPAVDEFITGVMVHVEVPALDGQLLVTVITPLDIEVFILPLIYPVGVPIVAINALDVV